MDGSCKAGISGYFEKYYNLREAFIQVNPVYFIYHLDFLQVKQFDWQTFKRNDYYIVVWWKDIPLGHLYSNDHPVPENENEWIKLIWQVITPALMHYQAINDRRQIPLCTNDSTPNDEELYEYLNTLFGDYTIRKESANKKVSLIICTRNRPSFLQECLRSIELLDHKPYEIIVVDNAPSDLSTRQVVFGFKNVMYVLEPVKGLDFARNAGVLKSTGDIIAFTDDDVKLHANWVEQIENSFDSPKTMAVTGIVFANQLETISQYYFEKYWGFNRGYVPLTYGIEYFLDHANTAVPVWQFGAGASMAFRKEIFEALGMFDERLDVGAAGCSGDSEFWYRVIAEGWDVYYNPRLIADHLHRRDEIDFKKQIFQYMRGFTSALLIQYTRYRHRGELNHLFKSLPAYYFREFLRGVKGGFSGRQSTIKQEIGGCISGITYFLLNRHKKSYEMDFQKVSFSQNMGDQPLVSVIITTFNHANFIPEAIQSVLAQTYDKIEIIIIDDGSTDNTNEVINAFPSVKYCFQQNKGLSAARNTGIEFSTGQFLVFLDADDWLYPDAVRINLSYFKKNAHVAFVSGNHHKVDKKSRIIKRADPAIPDDHFYEHLLQGNFIGMHAAVMYRKEIFDYFKFDQRLRACEDYDLYLRIARMCPVYCHQEYISAYRIHGNNMSNRISKMASTVTYVLEKHYLTLPILKYRPYFKKGMKNWKDYYAGEIITRHSFAWNDLDFKDKAQEYIVAFSAKPLLLLIAEIKRFVYRLRHFIKRNSFPFFKKVYYRTIGYEKFKPVSGKVDWGQIRELKQISEGDGLQISPVKNYYLNKTLADFKPFIMGNLLVIIPPDFKYINDFYSVIPPQKTVIEMGDAGFKELHNRVLRQSENVHFYDTILWINSLSFSKDPQNDLVDSLRYLKPDGTLLLTVEGVSAGAYSATSKNPQFAFSGKGIQKILKNCFNENYIQVKTRGNVFAAAANLGFADIEQYDLNLLDETDPQIQVFISAIVTQGKTNDRKRII